MKILSIVGTRPNFMKIAPLLNEFKKRNYRHVLLHTGQHYDQNMSRLFFDDLGLPRPDITLDCSSSPLVEQTAMLMRGIGRILTKEKPNLVVVVGDVSSTFAGAYAAKQLHIPLAHIESGLRSFDWSMPEEINRILTDRISDYLFVTEQSGVDNLLREGIPKEKIFFVGNVMIDTLLSHRKRANSSRILEHLGITEKGYCVLTLHRPSNVDTKKSLHHIISIISAMQKISKIVFPIHPRTRKNLIRFGYRKKLESMKNLIVTDPLGYLDFLKLMDSSRIVFTDSGGIQEETTVLGIPCITIRDNTERPITVKCGSNVLVSTKHEEIIRAAKKILKGKKARLKIPPLWDGRASHRIANILSKL